jgi:hypothetical protein
MKGERLHGGQVAVELREAIDLDHAGWVRRAGWRQQSATIDSREATELTWRNQGTGAREARRASRSWFPSLPWWRVACDRDGMQPSVGTGGARARQPRRGCCARPSAQRLLSHRMENIVSRSRRTSLETVVWIGMAALAAACGGNGRQPSAADGEARGESTASGEVTKPLPAESTTQSMVAAPSTAAEATRGAARTAADTGASRAGGGSATPAALQPRSQTGASRGTAKPKSSTPD